MIDNHAQQNEKLPKPAIDSQVVSIPIHATAIYTYKEAVANGKLKATTIGNQPRILGSYLLEWIESGGETGRSKATM
jgi:hypothetical protein